MRNLSPQRRRAAAICGVCAAIIPSTTLLMHRVHPSKLGEFSGGLIVGMAFAISLATLIRSRRACS